MPRAKYPIFEVDGIKFYRKPSGYYKSDSVRHDGQYMHRYVWEKHNGPIPAGHHVHHINGDKSDNRIENLACLSAGRHVSGHMREYLATEKGRADSLVALEKARPRAAAWHASREGFELHKQLGKLSWENRERVRLTCSHCGWSYFGYREMQKRGFCSASCQGMARKKTGVDDETRKCVVCGAEFQTNRYGKTKTCSKTCWKSELSRAKLAANASKAQNIT